MKKCMLCPRCCGVDREAGEVGYCRMPATMYVARMAPHYFEEPPISGTGGSGTVFFAGCSLRCVFCQNQSISRAPVGKAVSEEELGERILRLAAGGVHNISFVTATHYTDTVARVLQRIKKELHIPVVWNSGGYERPETLRLLEGLVDIYLPDFKYMDEKIASLCSDAPDYGAYAAAALAEMYRQTGEVKMENGLLLRGTVVRHLVLPGFRHDSMAVLRKIAETVPVKGVLLSLMRQYTPDFAPPDAPKNLRRRLTQFEYESVLAEAERLGFEGFIQEKSSAEQKYTPDFSKTDF